jgi:endonuclease/exonuclease/phosphatase family metal-dependent hydrolase
MYRAGSLRAVAEEISKYKLDLVRVQEVRWDGGGTEELEQVFDKFPKYHMKILLGDFNAKIGREDIFKPTVGNESVLKISNDNRVRVINFATSKNLTVKSTMFPNHNIHKFTWTFSEERRTTK